MQLTRFVRIVLNTLTAVILLLAVSLNTAGLATPSWQTVELTQTHQQHLRGLWEDCVAGQRNLPNAGWICIYKRYGHSDARNWMQSNGQLRDAFEYNLADREDWKLAVLVLITMASVLGLFALFTTCCSGLNKCVAVTATVLTAVATMCSIVGVVYFVRNANDLENKFVLIVTEMSERKLGSSYFLAVAGCVVYILATLLSVIGLLLTTCRRLQDNDDDRIEEPSQAKRRRPPMRLDFAPISRPGQQLGNGSVAKGTAI